MKKKLLVVAMLLMALTAGAQEENLKLKFDFENVSGASVTDEVSGVTASLKGAAKVVEVGTRKIAPFYWPVPVCHRVYQSYHGGHKAWDISSGGTPVHGTSLLAADSGTVIFAQVGWNGGYGNMVKIRHANGIVTLYAHMQGVYVSEGQRVSRGQQIGTVGNTGASEGPHLHFEMLINGRKVNPYPYIR